MLLLLKNITRHIHYVLVTSHYTENTAHHASHIDSGKFTINISGTKRNSVLSSKDNENQYDPMELLVICQIQMETETNTTVYVH